MLESHGYRVLEAADGEQGLKTFLRYRDSIAAVVTDISMPNMNGRLMAQGIEQIKSGMPIVVMSGDASDSGGDWQADADRAGRFISKPFSADQLLEILARILRKR